MSASVIANSLAHIFLKYNAKGVAAKGFLGINLSPFRFFNVSPIFLIALTCFGTSVLFYSKVLEKLNLNLAFPIMNTCVYLVVGIISWLIFKEKYSARQFSGFLITLIGLYLFAWR